MCEMFLFEPKNDIGHKNNLICFFWSRGKKREGHPSCAKEWRQVAGSCNTVVPMTLTPSTRRRSAEAQPPGGWRGWQPVVNHVANISISFFFFRVCLGRRSPTATNSDVSVWTALSFFTTSFLIAHSPTSILYLTQAAMSQCGWHGHFYKLFLLLTPLHQSPASYRLLCGGSDQPPWHLLRPQQAYTDSCTGVISVVFCNRILEFWVLTTAIVCLI